MPSTLYIIINVLPQVGSKFSSSGTKSTALIKNTIAPFTTTEIIKDLNASVFYVMTTDACNDKTEYIFPLKPCEIVFSSIKGF